METHTPAAPASSPGQLSESETVRAPGMVYGLEDRVPGVAAWLVSFQQVAGMVVGTITPPLILAGILKFDAADTAYFVSMALLASALGTFLQTRRFGVLGSGLLSVTGTSFSFLQPLIAAGQTGGLALMFGMSLVTAPLQILLAPALPRLRTVFTPLVSGVVVLLIGLSLIPSAMFGITAPLAADAPVWSGGAVAAFVIAVVLGVQAIGKPWARLSGVLIGVVAGYVVCGIFGWLQKPAMGDGAWLALPKLFPHGFAFRWELVLPFAFIYLVSLLEAMGDMTATAQLSGLKTEGPDHWKRLRGGVLVDGITSTVSAAFGAFPCTTYAQNNGVIQITGVASRRIGPLMALMLAALGLFPAVGRWITAMPPPVLGALALLLFGLVAVSGLRLIVSAGLTHRDALVVAVALGVGLGAPTNAAWLATLPEALKSLLESGIAAGGLTALVLNQLLPKGRPRESASADAE